MSGGGPMSGGDGPVTGGPISVLVVDDDFRVAQIHAGFVAALPGFTVAAIAHTAAQARSMAAELAPDLVLLDVYLPDASGLSLLAELDADVIMATAATDPHSVRTALRQGALHYLVKPFSAEALGARLIAYARYRRALTGEGELHQSSVDAALRALYSPLRSDQGAPKGQSPVTVRLVTEALRRADTPRSAVEIADEVGISRATAQRYLSRLASGGRVLVSLRYGATGRPEHQYAWSPRP